MKRFTQSAGIATHDILKFFFEAIGTRSSRKFTRITIFNGEAGKPPHGFGGNSGGAIETRAVQTRALVQPKSSQGLSRIRRFGRPTWSRTASGHAHAKLRSRFANHLAGHRGGATATTSSVTPR